MVIGGVNNLKFTPASPSEAGRAIYNFSRRRRNGFSLIEVLVVIFLLGVITAIAVNLFFSILKGGSKAEIVKEVKQNGDYAISVMERMTRNAQNAFCCQSEACPDLDKRTKQNVVFLKITDPANPDSLFTVFSCKSTGEAVQIASNSSDLETNYLTSANVTATNCTFYCEGTSPEVVTISFILSQKGSPARAEEKATQNFQTKVSLRTYE